MAREWCLGIGLAVFLLWGPGLLRAESNFTQGEELFLRNRPREALPFLEAAVADDPFRVQTFQYLGIAYQQLNRLDDAISTYQKILPLAGEETARIAYNLGNAYYAKGNTAVAQEYYTISIEADPAHASAYLNRANALVKTGSYQDAIPDYERYLSLEPYSNKRPRIEQLVAYIREEFYAGERRRILAEEQARQAEERRRQILEEVSSSLQSAADEIKGVSAGTEEVQGYDGEFELE